MTPRHALTCRLSNTMQVSPLPFDKGAKNKLENKKTEFWANRGAPLLFTRELKLYTLITLGFQQVIVAQHEGLIEVRCVNSYKPMVSFRRTEYSSA